MKWSTYLSPKRWNTNIINTIKCLLQIRRHDHKTFDTTFQFNEWGFDCFKQFVVSRDLGKIVQGKCRSQCIRIQPTDISRIFIISLSSQIKHAKEQAVRSCIVMVKMQTWLGNALDHCEDDATQKPDIRFEGNAILKNTFPNTPDHLNQPYYV